MSQDTLGPHEVRVKAIDDQIVSLFHLPRLEGLRGRARELRVNVGGANVEGVSLSIGVAQAPDHGSSEEDLLRAADHALYTAKESGRDRIVAFGSA